MLFPTSAEWAGRGLTSDKHRFFYLIWDEIFHPRTQDTWQVRTTGIRAILDEIIEVVDVTTDYHAGYIHHLDYVVKEALLVAKLDPVVSSTFTCVRKLFEPWRERKPQRNDLQTIHDHACILKSLVSDYRDNVVAELRAELLDTSSDRKERLRKLTMALATDLRCSGFSLRYLRSLSDLITGDEIQHGLPKLVQAVSRHPRKYTCYFSITGDRAMVDAYNASPDVSFFFGPPKLSPTAPPAERGYWAKTTPREIGAEITVKALDRYAAIDEAEKRLDRSFASMSLYRFSTEYGIKGERVLVVDDQSGLSVEAISEVTRSYMADSRDALAKVARFLKLREELQPHDVEKFTSALQYHKLALSSASPAARLVNMWIALECLITRSDKTLISQIGQYVAPLVAIGNTYKLLRGVAIYLRFYAHRKPFADQSIVFPNSTQRRIEPEDLLQVLVEGDGGARIQALESYCADHPALLNRIGHLRHHVFHGPKSVASNLERHRDNVDWQLRRIYRVRNEITHRAANPSGIDQLVQNLHTYLTTTLNRMIHILGSEGRGMTIDEAFEYNRAMFEEYLQFMRSRDRYTATAELVCEPRSIARKVAGEPLWKAPKQAPDA